jgi:hypothetical protein
MEFLNKCRPNFMRRDRRSMHPRGDEPISTRLKAADEAEGEPGRKSPRPTNGLKRPGSTCPFQTSSAG